MRFLHFTQSHTISVNIIRLFSSTSFLILLSNPSKLVTPGKWAPTLIHIPLACTSVEWVAAAAAAKSLQSCLTLCDPIDSCPPGSPVPGILQARTLEWVAISFSNTWKWKIKVKLLSSCLTPSDPMDCSPTGFSVHGIFQARVLEWVAIVFSHWMGWADANQKQSLPPWEHKPAVP